MQWRFDHLQLHSDTVPTLLSRHNSDPNLVPPLPNKELERGPRTLLLIDLLHTKFHSISTTDLARIAGCIINCVTHVMLEQSWQDLRTTTKVSPHSMPRAQVMALLTRFQKLGDRKSVV